jgi:cytoskeleton protein RodZ
MAYQVAQAGAMLRQLRESAGIDPMVLASALKVTLQKIQALEQGQLDELPGLAFARGLATAICRYFAADPEPVLALMPQAVLGLPGEIDTPREPIKPSTFHMDGGDLLPRRPRVPGWVMILVAVLLVGGLALWLVPERHPNVPGPQADSSVAENAEPVASVDSAAAGIEPESVTEPASASEPQAASAVEVASQSAPASAAATVPAASAKASAAASAAQASALKSASSTAPTTSSVFDVSGVASAASAAASAPQTDQQGSGIVEQDVVTFNATGQVWVGVHDGSGKPIVNRVLAQGDTLTAGGELPLSVTVGDKTAVTVTVRGQPFDLNQHTRRNGTVARFTIDPASSP